jgi:hypothetical protein
VIGVRGKSVCWQTYLKSLLPREALVAVAARERLDGQVYAFMAFDIGSPIETLRT